MLDRCTLNKGAFAFKIVRRALKWPLKAGSRLIEVAATAGLTVLLSYDVVSGTEITPCNKIEKTLVVDRFLGKCYEVHNNVASIMTKL